MSEQISEDYLRAYRRASPSGPELAIWYCGGGWYGVKEAGTALRPWSYRRKQIVEMTERLTKRVQSSATPS
jgi:hypothetical protein